MNSKPIPEYENYILFEDGRVLNTKNNNVVATQPNSRGYLTVNLWKHNKMKKFMVHRLLAQLFIPNPNEYPCVNHIDQDKQNNTLSNLEWCTYKYNSNHSLKKMRDARDSVGRTTPVRQLVNNEWVYYNSINEAHRFTGISVNTIRTSLKNVYKNPKYIWEYVNKQGQNNELS